MEENLLQTGPLSFCLTSFLNVLLFKTVMPFPSAGFSFCCSIQLTQLLFHLCHSYLETAAEENNPVLVLQWLTSYLGGVNHFIFIFAAR